MIVVVILVSGLWARPLPSHRRNPHLHHIQQRNRESTLKYNSKTKKTVSRFTNCYTKLVELLSVCSFPEHNTSSRSSSRSLSPYREGRRRIVLCDLLIEGNEVSSSRSAMLNTGNPTVVGSLQEDLKSWMDEPLNIHHNNSCCLQFFGNDVDGLSSSCLDLLLGVSLTLR